MFQTLQAGRAAAAALVVLFHLGGTFAQDKYFGFKALDVPFLWADAGVEFFFVLSGFLITHAHRRDFGRPAALGAYLSKRALRIYPTYWIICLAVSLAALVFPSLRSSLPSDALVFLKGLLLIPQDPDVVGGFGSPILFVAWSLHYELLFYLVFAIAIASRPLAAVVVLALLAAQVSCPDGAGCTFPLSFVSSPLIFLFGMGVVCAVVVQQGWRLPAPRLLGWIGVLAFGSAGVLEIAYGRDVLPMDRRLVYGVISSLIIVSMVQAEESGAVSLKHRWVALLGNSSYALYLMHIPVISVLCKVFVAIGAHGAPVIVGLFILTFVVCVALAAMFYQWVERPLLAALRRRMVPAQHRHAPSGPMSTVDPAAARARRP